MVESNKRQSKIFGFAMMMAICCLISGVLLCSELTKRTIEDRIPVEVIDVVDEVLDLEEDMNVLVRNRIKANPSVIFSDSDMVWINDHNLVNIFKVSYDNDSGDITVDGGSNKVIAPGTTNTYYFEIENNGNVGVEYQVTMDAYISSNMTTIPVDAKLSDYTGKYIIGSETSWENVLNVSPERVNETGELSVGNKMRYEFLWQWPYEHGDDAFDTMLGNLAVDEDLTLTVEINVLATADEYADGGFATGDDTNINMTLMATVGSFAMFIFLLALRRKEAENEEN